MLGNQSMYQKFFSAKTQKDATRAVVGWFVGIVILESVIVAIAVLGSALFPGGEVHDRPREILAYTAMHGLPHILGAIMVGAIFAKVISTANNYLFSPATNLINDVFVRYIRPDASNKQVLLVSRILVVFLGLWSLWQSLGTTSVLKRSLYAYTIYSAALTPVILAAFFWKRATASQPPSPASPLEPSSRSSGIPRPSSGSSPPSCRSATPSSLPWWLRCFASSSSACSRSDHTAAQLAPFAEAH